MASWRTKRGLVGRRMIQTRNTTKRTRAMKTAMMDNMRWSLALSWSWWPQSFELMAAFTGGGSGGLGKEGTFSGGTENSSW